MSGVRAGAADPQGAHMSGTMSRGTSRGLLVSRRGTGDRAGRPYTGHWYLYGPYLPLEPLGRRAPLCGLAPAPREKVRSSSA